MSSSSATDNNDDLPIPGSIFLTTDTDEDRKIILSPKPSDDVNDPLNWSKSRKQIWFASLIIYVFTQGVAGSTFTAVLTQLSENNGVSIADLNAGTGYSFLLLGWGGLLTQPLAMTFGKRGMYILSAVASVCLCIWASYCRSSSAWYVSRVVAGIFGSPIEMLPEVSISDVFFAHERGYYMGLYVIFIAGSNYFAPVFSGFVNDRWGWLSVFYISEVIYAVGAVAVIFLMEETNYQRTSTEQGEVHEAAQGLPNVEEMAEVKEKGMGITLVIPVLSEDRGLEGVPTPYLARLKFWNRKYHSLSEAFAMAYRPLLLFRFPAIFWGGFTYGSQVVWFSVLGATASVFFSSAPYNFPASSVGLTYIGPLIGSTIAGLYSGWFADKYSLWQARNKKHGLREPEQRLHLLSTCIILSPLGLLLYGCGAAAGSSWVMLVFGMAILAAGCSVGSTFSINYVLDCYKDLAAEAMISVILVRNTMVFAMDYGITPWLAAEGERNTFITCAVLALVINASYLLFIKWGKHWRASSKTVYWHYVKTSIHHKG